MARKKRIRLFRTLKGTKDKGLTFHQGKDAQRHDQNGDHQIGDGQRHEEVVGHILQPALPGDGQADQDVPGRRSQDETEDAFNEAAGGNGVGGVQIALCLRYFDQSWQT